MQIQSKVRFWKITVLIITLVLIQGCSTHQDLYKDARTNYAKGNDRLVVEDLYSLATRGDVAAQYGLGYAYYNGFGVAQDRDTGRLWIKKAADADYPPAVVAYKKITQTTDFPADPATVSLGKESSN